MFLKRNIYRGTSLIKCGDSEIGQMHIVQVFDVMQTTSDVHWDHSAHRLWAHLSAALWWALLPPSPAPCVRNQPDCDATVP